MTIAVRLVCSVKGCHRVLAVVDETPAAGDSAWRDPKLGLWVESCHKHGGVPPKLTIDEYRAKRQAKGIGDLDRSRLMHFITWADLQPDFERSAATRRVVTRPVVPRQR